MPRDKLLHEIIALIDSVLRRPSFYYEPPRAAEAFVMGLLGVAIAIETSDTLGKSLSQVWEEVKELTEDVPANREHVRFLCDEQIVPERTDSNQALMKRGRLLCARLLTSWPEGAGPGNSEGDKD
jgi:hypothetical protein